jgi:hypothetical protein
VIGSAKQVLPFIQVNRQYFAVYIVLSMFDL